VPLTPPVFPTVPTSALEVIPPPGLVGDAVLVDVPELSELVGDVGPAVVGEAQPRRVLKPLARRDNPPADVGVGEQPAQRLGRLDAADDPRPCGPDGLLLVRPQQEHQVDHEIAAAEGLDQRRGEGLQAGLGGAHAQLAPVVGGAVGGDVDVERFGTERPGGGLERLRVPGALHALRQHTNGRAAPDTAQGQLDLEHPGEGAARFHRLGRDHSVPRQPCHRGTTPRSLRVFPQLGEPIP